MSGFDVWDDDDIVRLVGEHPLAWIVPHADPAVAAPMPLLLDCDAGGRPERLVGHLPRQAPLVRVLAAAPTATFLFTGPHRYISPGWLPQPDWAPTWNFVTARLTGDVRFDPSRTADAIERMVAHMEKDSGWSVDALGARYDRLLAHVVGFVAPIDRIDARFKLGQDETDESFGAIVDHLRATPLADWMCRRRSS